MDEDSLCFEHFTDESRSLRNSLNKLRLDRKFCDSTIKTKDGGSFPVHKIILISLCPYFEILFDGGNVELDITVKSDAFALIIEYIYTGSIKKRNINLNIAIEIYEAASYLSMNILKNLIGEYLISSVDMSNCLTLWRSGAKQMNEELQNKTVELIKRNCLEFLNSHLLELDENEIKKILNFENINISQEELLSKLLKWFKADYIEHRICITDLMKQINFKEISTDYINTKIFDDDILFQNQLILQFCLKELRSRDKEDKPTEKVNENIYFPKSVKTPLFLTPTTFNEIDMNEKKIVKVFDWKRQNGFSVTKCRESELFFTGPGRSCEIFSNFECRKLPSMLQERTHHKSIYLNDRIYCCGGDNSKITMEYFDLNRMEWIKGSSFVEQPTCVFQYDGFLYSSCWHNPAIQKYDSKIDKWTYVQMIGNLKTPQHFANGIEYKNKIFLTNYRNQVFHLELKNDCFEVVKTYDIQLPLKSEYPRLIPFIHQDDLYLFARYLTDYKTHCCKLNQMNETFEIFCELEHYGSSSESAFIL